MRIYLHARKVLLTSGERVHRHAVLMMRGRRGVLLLRLRDFRIAFGELEPDRLRHLRIEPHSLLLAERRRMREAAITKRKKKLIFKPSKLQDLCARSVGSPTEESALQTFDLSEFVESRAERVFGSSTLFWP